MAYLVSPGIDTNEVDLTNIVPATSTSIAGYAGHFNWGPVDSIVTVASEKELAASYGSPAQGDMTRSFLTAASFLKYSNSLRVSRAIGSGAVNAANASPILIKNKDIFDTLTGLSFIFSARYPGKIGNSLTVSYAHVAGSADSSYDDWAFKNLFDSAPNKSQTALASGIATNDEIHLVVIDTLGLITGTQGAVLEKYEGLSLGANAKNENGASIFYKEVINENSSYIYVNTLSGTFNDADEDITTASVFAVEESSVESVSLIELPFLQSVSTTVTYSGGSPIVTTDVSDVSVLVKSGYTGVDGNNVRMNLRISTNFAARVAHGYIKYGVPVNGDTVTVGASTFTKASTSSGLNFATAAVLATLISAVTDTNATVVGDYINIVAETTGTAANARVLAVGVSNAGTMSVSSATLFGGNDVNSSSLPYVDVTIDAPQPLTGHVTYDVTVSYVANIFGTPFNETTTTLANIIREIDYKKAILNNSNVPNLVFEVNDTVVTATSPIASMKLDVQTLMPFATGLFLTIYSFAGGETITYNDNTLINTYNLLAGTDGSISPGNVAIAMDLFADKELSDINFLFGEAFNTSQEIVDSKIYEVANARKDIVGFISTPIGVTQMTSNVQKKAAAIAKFDVLSSSSYIMFDQTPVYTYNKYADKYVWIPAAGHLAGLCANADFVADPWFSPAGFNRGQLKGVTKIAYNPSVTDRDDLYKKRINSIVSIAGEGIVLYGDKTALSKPSAFDRINVRRLFNVLERAISNAAKYQLFELNDEFTRASFKNTIEPFLRDVQGRRGIIDFQVVCDETNNTSEIIDSNQFVGDIYIKPARSINFIKLNFIATRTGVDFREIVGA